MNKKIVMAVMGVAMGMGISVTASAGSWYTNGCNWQGFGSLSNYCGYQSYVCQMGGLGAGRNCSTIKNQCMQECK